jgi:hypothetical protein
METQEIQKRELQGISEAMNTYNLKTGTIITMNEEREIKQNNTTIKIIPAWKWIMNSEEER